MFNYKLHVLNSYRKQIVFIPPVSMDKVGQSGLGSLPFTYTVEYSSLKLFIVHYCDSLYLL